MVEKVQLNDDQWLRLAALAVGTGTVDGLESRTLSTRLSSYGLVARDRTGREFLTERGMHRLSQGR